MTLLARPITISAAKAMVEEFHRHNDPPVSGLFALSAVEDDGFLAGVAIVARPTAPKLQDGVTAEVTRVCVSPFAPKNTCSMLYGRAARIWNEMGGRKIITYTLTTESGASLRAVGWTPKACRVPSGQGWNNRPGRKRQEMFYKVAKIRWERTF